MNQTPTLQVITAIEQDGVTVNSISIVCEILQPSDEFDLKQAVIDACKEYVRTPEGRETFSYNCLCFNWADFDVHVPNSICEKHGFRKLDTNHNEIVNWNEQLCDEHDFYHDEEE